MNDNESLTRVFAEVGGRHGYKDVEAKFAAFKDFKVKWVRSYRWAEFDVSDYLKGAPEEVMSALSDTLFKKMRGECEASYPEAVIDWMTDPSFRERNQPLYLSRCHAISRGSRASFVDLSDSMERLHNMGLVDVPEDVQLRWAFNSRSSNAAKSSVLMRTVIVSDRLDSQDVPQEVIDYVVYAQIAHISMGYRPGKGVDSKEYADMLERFPYMAQAEEGLRRLDMTL